MAPIPVSANQPPDMFYKGGPQISEFRNTSPPSGPREPEDWVASTTCCSGAESQKLGLSKLPDGRLLADAVASDPQYWLGDEHLKAYGTDTMFLFKLLDAGEKLPVHCHPHRDWAKKHLGSKHGKAETWHIMKDGHVHLGLTQDISHEELLSLVESQDSEALVKKLHKIDVKKGMTVYVPPGTLHAIGEGVFVVELQEAADISVLCEWKGFQIDGAKEGHLGLGFDTALTAVNRKGFSPEQVQQLVTPSDKMGSVVRPAALEYFDLERAKVDQGVEVRRGFAVVAVTEGKMTVKTKSGDKLEVKRGSTFVVPHGDGELEFQGEGMVLVARPPPIKGST